MEGLHRFDSFSLENVDNNVCVALADVQQEYYTPKSEMWRTLKDGDELDKYPPQELEATVDKGEDGRLRAILNGLTVGYLPAGKKDNAAAYKIIIGGGKSKRIFETDDGNLDYEVEDGDFIARLICYNFASAKAPAKASAKASAPVSVEYDEKSTNFAISIMVRIFIALSCLSLIGELAGAIFGLPVPVLPALGACVLFGIVAWALSAKL